MTGTEAYMLNRQKEIKKAHNARFVIDDKEYRIMYEGGISESFGVYERPVKGARKQFKYVTGFAGFRLADKQQVILMAKGMIDSLIKKSKI